jgi:hypothetical protein
MLQGHFLWKIVNGRRSSITMLFALIWTACAFELKNRTAPGSSNCELLDPDYEEMSLVKTTRTNVNRSAIVRRVSRRPTFHHLSFNRKKTLYQGTQVEEVTEVAERLRTIHRDGSVSFGEWTTTKDRKVRFEH